LNDIRLFDEGRIGFMWVSAVEWAAAHHWRDVNATDWRYMRLLGQFIGILIDRDRRGVGEYGVGWSSSLGGRRTRW
jgi:hypothetical protein